MVGHPIWIPATLHPVPRGDGRRLMWDALAAASPPWALWGAQSRLGVVFSHHPRDLDPETTGRLLEVLTRPCGGG